MAICLVGNVENDWSYVFHRFDYEAAINGMWIMKVKELIEHLQAIKSEDLDVVVINYYGEDIPLTKHAFSVFKHYDSGKLVLEVSVPDIGPEPD